MENTKEKNAANEIYQSQHLLRLIFLCFCASMFLHMNTSWSADDQYPVKLDPITKKQADYKTPENTLAAGFSALMYKNLEWYYTTLTEKSVEQEKAQFAEAGIDPSENVDLIEPGDQLFLFDKLNYKDGILLHVKVVSPDGTIATGPVVFVQEKGLWKQTFEYASDQDLHIYFDADQSKKLPVQNPDTSE